MITRKNVGTEYNPFYSYYRDGNKITASVKFTDAVDCNMTIFDELIMMLNDKFKDNPLTTDEIKQLENYAATS